MNLLQIAVFTASIYTLLIIGMVVSAMGTPNNTCIRIGLMDGSTCDFDSNTHKAEVTENWVKVYGGFGFTELKLCLNSKVVGCVFFDYKYKEDNNDGCC